MLINQTERMNYRFLCASAKLNGEFVLLEAVRVQCKSCGGSGVAEMDYGQYARYCGCVPCGGHHRPPSPTKASEVPMEQHGLGWTPATDLAVWLQAALEIDYEIFIMKQPTCFHVSFVAGDYPEGSFDGVGYPWANGETVEAAVLTTIYRALEAMGCFPPGVDKPET